MVGIINKKKKITIMTLKIITPGDDLMTIKWSLLSFVMMYYSLAIVGPNCFFFGPFKLCDEKEFYDFGFGLFQKPLWVAAFMPRVTVNRIMLRLFMGKYLCH